MTQILKRLSLPLLMLSNLSGPTLHAQENSGEIKTSNTQLAPKLIGDGQADNSSALTEILKGVERAYYGSSQRLPVGNFSFSKPQIMNGPISLHLNGGGFAQSNLLYNGTARVPALELLNDIGSRFSIGLHLQDISIVGNQSSTAALSVGPSMSSVFQNLYLGPASSRDGSCFYELNGVGNLYSMLQCSGNIRGWQGRGKPFYGLVFDSKNLDSASTTSTLISPTVEQVIGCGICLHGVGGFTITSAQLSNNGLDLLIDQGANQNTIISSLGELQGTQRQSGKIMGKNNYFLSDALDGLVEVSSGSRQNIFENSALPGHNGVSLHIGEGSSMTSVSHSIINPRTLLDESKDTEYENNVDTSSGQAVSNFPLYRHALPMPTSLDGNVDGDRTTVLEGTWYCSDSTSTFPALQPTKLAAGRAWKAVFIGAMQVVGLPYSQDSTPYFDLSDTANVSPNGLTFSVDRNDGVFKISDCKAAANGSGGFTGLVVFMPMSNIVAGAGGTQSMNLSGTIAAQGLTLRAIKAKTGMRYVCIDTKGKLHSSPTPCSGS